ncbi:MarR family winged helix-turn-helix transcriptional regulator [Lutispora thermophila]|uniref:DNA-binding transcriptional regulator, MarR family n=1 Tax=Lutispora thermophila DSM 19022 TaxID=1122184 RepID=A0A1M6HCF1_9FIRM|nr:MarR family transcriptional regulator [Lutispora thermophila]SHJ19813.1 DNA-binding transcriptional regulator, MarR family [Lutispora thermophila DSM 19022]
MKICIDMKELDKVAYELHKKLFAKITEGIDIPVTSTQIYMLFYIRTQEQCMVSDIANYLGVTMGAVTSLVDRLFDFGLVNRYRSEIDRRQVIIKLSEKGGDLLKKIDMKRMELFDYYTKDVDKEDLNYLNDVMDKIIMKILNS